MSKNLPAKKEIIEHVQKAIRGYLDAGQLHMPKNYSAENAMKSAWLIIQETLDRNKKPALEVCTRESVVRALMDMTVQALNPVKKQCYFIVYGKQLVCQRSYFGDVAVLKRATGAKDVRGVIVYRGDMVKMEVVNGERKITEHQTSWENMEKGIAGAYVIITREDGSEKTDIMSIERIKKSWAKSKMNPASDNSTHSQFPEEMVLRTVIRHAVKIEMNSSDDSGLLIETYHRSQNEEEVASLEEAEQKQLEAPVIDIEAEKKKTQPPVPTENHEAKPPNPEPAGVPF